MLVIVVERKIVIALFRYQARSQSGKLVQGIVQAASQAMATQELKRRGYFLVEFANTPTKPFWKALPRGKRISPQDLSVFAYQLGAMLGAGVPLLFALELGKLQSPVALQEALTNIDRRLREGHPLAHALGQHPHLFPPLMVSMVEAGELGGVLEETLGWLAAHYDREAQVTEKIKSALAYPLLVLVTTGMAVVFMLTFVLPNFAQMLGNMDVPLPYLTQVVLNIGSFFVSWGLLFIMLIVGLTIGTALFLRTPAGKSRWDDLVLRLPLAGNLVTNVLTARFCHTLGALLESGVPILSCLAVVKKTLTNQVVVANLTLAETSLREGRGLAHPLKEAGIFPPLLIQMVAVGEETGRLPSFLLKLSEFYDREVARGLERFTALLEPILLLLLGGLVGGIVVALLLPLFNIVGSV